MPSGSPVTQQPPEASRIVEEAGVRILDELAVEGGRAARAHLFDKCQVKLWGHVVNVAARRAGYTGHNEAEVERHGKEQLFLEAMHLLLEREQIVVWDEAGSVIALHPTHRDEYIPGTNLWRSQRQTVLNELREQLLQFRAGKIIGDQSFDPTLQKAVALYAQQLRRGQLAGDTREEAIGELLGLADVLFDPARLAQLLGIDESDVRTIAARRYEPTKVTPTTKRPKRKSRQSASEDDSRAPQNDSRAAEEDSQAPIVAPKAPSLTGADIKRERLARGLTQVQLANEIGIHETQMVYAEKGSRPTPAYRVLEIERWFREHPVINGTVS